MTKAASRDGEPLIFFKEVLNEAFRARDVGADNGISILTLLAPTASALIQQRKKISLEAFDSLFYSFSNAFSLDKTLKGYDPIAVDGSYIYVDEMYGQYVKGAAEVTKAGLTSFIK